MASHPPPPPPPTRVHHAPFPHPPHLRLNYGNRQICTEYATHFFVAAQPKSRESKLRCSTRPPRNPDKKPLAGGSRGCCCIAASSLKKIHDIAANLWEKPKRKKWGKTKPGSKPFHSHASKTQWAVPELQGVMGRAKRA